MVWAVAVVLTAIEVLERCGGIAKIELGIADGRVALLPGSVGRLDGASTIEGMGGELVVACRQVGQFLPDVKRTGELLGGLTVVARVGGGDVGACPNGRDVGSLPTHIVSGEGAVLYEEREVGRLVGTSQLELLFLIVRHGSEQLLVALAASGGGAAAKCARCGVVGLGQRVVVGILVIVLHLQDEVLEFLHVGYSLVLSIVVHGSGSGCDSLHLKVRECAVEDLEVVEQGMLHDGISGEG